MAAPPDPNATRRSRLGRVADLLDEVPPANSTSLIPDIDIPTPIGLEAPHARRQRANPNHSQTYGHPATQPRPAQPNPAEVDPFLYLAKPTVVQPGGVGSRESSSSASSLVPETVWHVEPADPAPSRIPAGFQFYGTFPPPPSAQPVSLPVPAPGPTPSPAPVAAPPPPQPQPKTVCQPPSKWPTKSAGGPPPADPNLLTEEKPKGTGPHTIVIVKPETPKKVPYVPTHKPEEPPKAQYAPPPQHQTPLSEVQPAVLNSYPEGQGQGQAAPPPYTLPPPQSQQPYYQEPQKQQQYLQPQPLERPEFITPEAVAESPRGALPQNLCVHQQQQPSSSEHPSPSPLARQNTPPPEPQQPYAVSLVPQTPAEPVQQQPRIIIHPPPNTVHIDQQHPGHADELVTPPAGAGKQPLHPSGTVHTAEQKPAQTAPPQEEQRRPSPAMPASAPSPAAPVAASKRKAKQRTLRSDSADETPPSSPRRHRSPPQPIVIRVEQASPASGPPTALVHPDAPQQRTGEDLGRLVGLVDDLRVHMGDWKADVKSQVDASMGQMEHRFVKLLNAQARRLAAMSAAQGAGQPQPQAQPQAAAIHQGLPEELQVHQSTKELEIDMEPFKMDPIPPLRLPKMPPPPQRKHHKHHPRHRKREGAAQPQQQPQADVAPQSVPLTARPGEERDPDMLATSHADLQLVVDRLHEVQNEMSRIEINYAEAMAAAAPPPPPQGATAEDMRRYQEDVQRRQEEEMQRVAQVLGALRDEIQRWMRSQREQLHTEVLAVVNHKVETVKQHAALIEKQFAEVKQKAEEALEEAEDEKHKLVHGHRDALVARRQREGERRDEAMMTALLNFKEKMMSALHEQLDTLAEQGKEIFRDAVNVRRASSSSTGLPVLPPLPSPGESGAGYQAYEEHLRRLYDRMLMMRNEVQRTALFLEEQQTNGVLEADRSRVASGLQQVIDTIDTKGRHAHEEIDEVFRQLQRQEAEDPQAKASISTIAQAAAGLIESAAAEHQQHMEAMVQSMNAALHEQLEQLKLAASCVARGDKSKTALFETQQRLLQAQDEQIQAAEAELRDLSRKLTALQEQQLAEVKYRLSQVAEKGSREQKLVEQLDAAIQQWVLYQDLADKRRDQEHQQQVQQLEAVVQQQQQQHTQQQQNLIEQHQKLQQQLLQHQQHIVKEEEEDIEEEDIAAPSSPYPAGYLPPIVPPGYMPYPYPVLQQPPPAPPPPPPSPPPIRIPSRLPSMLQHKVNTLRQELEQLEDADGEVAVEEEMETFLSAQQQDWQHESRIKKLENCLEALKERKAEEERAAQQLRTQYEAQVHKLELDHERTMRALQTRMEEMKQQQVRWISEADKTAAELQRRRATAEADAQELLAAARKELAAAQADVSRPFSFANTLALQRETQSLRGLEALRQQMSDLRERIEKNERRHLEKEMMYAEAVQQSAKRKEEEQAVTLAALCQATLAQKKQLQRETRRAAQEAERIAQQRSESEAAQRELERVRVRREEVGDAVRRLALQREQEEMAMQEQRQAREREAALTAELQALKQKELETQLRLQKQQQLDHVRRRRSALLNSARTSPLPSARSGVLLSRPSLTTYRPPVPPPPLPMRLPAPPAPPPPPVPPQPSAPAVLTTRGSSRPNEAAANPPTASLITALLNAAAQQRHAAAPSSNPIHNSGAPAPAPVVPPLPSAAFFPQAAPMPMPTYYPTPQPQPQQQFYAVTPAPSVYPQQQQQPFMVISPRDPGQTQHTSKRRHHHRSRSPSHSHEKKRKSWHSSHTTRISPGRAGKRPYSPPSHRSPEREHGPLYSGRMWSTPPRPIIENGKLLQPPPYEKGL